MDLGTLITPITVVAVVLILFVMGLHLTVPQMTALWRQPRLLFRSLLAVVVLVPLLAWIATRVVPLPSAVVAGLMITAASPGPSLGPKLAERAGGDVPYAVTLMATLVLVALVSTPVTLGLTLQGSGVNPLDIARIVLLLQLLPLGIGLAFRHFWANGVTRWIAPLTTLSNVLFPLVILLILIRDFGAVFTLTPLIIATMAVLALLSLGIGHLLGGPELVDRAPLATFSSYRNAALALLLLQSFGAETTVAAIAYEVCALVVVVLYGLVVRQRIRAAGVAG